MLRDLNSLFLQKDKKGFVHYVDLARILTKYFKYTSYKKSCNEDTPSIRKETWSKIKTGKYQRKQRTSWKGLTEAEKTKVAKFWESKTISRVSPHDTWVLKRKSKLRANAEVTPVFYRQYSIKECHRKFIETFPEMKGKCSRTTFFNLKPKWVKKPQSRFDVCPIHKEIKLHKQKLEAKFKKTNEEIILLNSMKFHEEVCETRQKEYDDSIMNLKYGIALITIDFKANINLGKSNEVDSSVWFSSPQRTVFGAVVLFRGKDGKLYKIIFTIVSRILNHDSKTVIDIVKKIIAHKIFEYFDTKHLEFWMDNAPNHFRTMEMLAGFHSLVGGNIESVRAEYFPEYHGKSECDRHFGLISRMVIEYCRQADAKQMNTTEDFLEFYKNTIRNYGGMVIPKVGAVYSELNEDSGTNLNVVAMEYFPNEYEKQILDEEKKMKSGDRKQKFSFIFPYERKIFCAKDFIFSHYYSFIFKKETRPGKKMVLRAKLFKRAKCSNDTFRFSIDRQIKHDYKVRVGVQVGLIQLPMYNS